MKYAWSMAKHGDPRSLGALLQRVSRGLAASCIILAMLVMAPQLLRAQDHSNVDLRVLTPPPDGPTSVFVDLYGIEIFSIKEREGTFEIEAYLRAWWLDDRLAFDPIDLGAEKLVYQGEAAVEMLKSGMWWPYFEITDARGSRDRMYTELEINKDGEVYYRERFHTFIEQGFSLSAFPFDRHIISFSVEPYVYDTKSVTFQRPDELGKSSAWQPEDWFVEQFKLEISNDDEFANATVEMEIVRDSRHYIFNIILPLVLIVFISSAVFWMSFDTMHLGDRLSVSFTSLLTVVAFDFVTADSLPRLGYSTVLDSILSWSYVFIAVNIFENVLASKLYDSRSALTERLDKGFRWLYPPAYVVVLFILIAVGVDGLRVR